MLFFYYNYYYYFNHSVGLKYGICFVGIIIIITLMYLMAYLLMFPFLNFPKATMKHKCCACFHTYKKCWALRVHWALRAILWGSRSLHLYAIVCSARSVWSGRTDLWRQQRRGRGLDSSAAPGCSGQTLHPESLLCERQHGMGDWLYKVKILSSPYSYFRKAYIPGCPCALVGHK